MAFKNGRHQSTRGSTFERFPAKLMLFSRSFRRNMGDKENAASFITAPGFCPDCGSILPLLAERGGVTCFTCKRNWGPEVFGDMAISYSLHFNNEDAYASSTKKVDDDEEEADGPIVERRCPQCQNDKMSYATLQLRSADEGQTVFYTCTKCKFKETENS